MQPLEGILLTENGPVDVAQLDALHRLVPEEMIDDNA
jgi:hypothetical protein